MPLLLHIHRLLLVASFAIWFGGFGFYVSIVVPAGTEVLGSAHAQGMITRVVTESMNVFCAVAVIMMLLESIVGWRRSRKSQRVTMLVLTLTIAVMLGALFILHPAMNHMIDSKTGAISDRQQFYSLHRIYLWVSTAQWATAWIWLSMLVKNWYAIPADE